MIQNPSVDFPYRSLHVEEKPYRYACLEPYPKRPHLLVSILEDHTIDNPSDIVTSLVVINTITKTLQPLVSGTNFYALPRFSPDSNHITWQQWYHPDMPWDGREIYIADVVINDNTLFLNMSVLLCRVHMHRQHLNTNITKHIDPTHQKPFKALIDKMDDTSTLLPPNELQPQSPPHLPSFNKGHVQRRSRAQSVYDE